MPTCSQRKVSREVAHQLEGSVRYLCSECAFDQFIYIGFRRSRCAECFHLQSAPGTNVALWIHLGEGDELDQRLCYIEPAEGWTDRFRQSQR